MATERTRRLFLILMLSLLALVIRIRSAHAGPSEEHYGYDIAAGVENQLQILVNDQTPWTSESVKDVRNVRLSQLTTVVDHLRSETLRKNEVLIRIRSLASTLRVRLKDTIYPKQIIINFITIGDLWSPTDLPFFLDEIKDGKAEQFMQPILELAPHLSATERAQLREAIIHRPNVNEVDYSILFKAGLAQRNDITDLIRHFLATYVKMGDSLGPEYLEFFPEHPMGMMPDGDQAGFTPGEMMATVLKTLHERYLAKDFLVLSAVKEARKPLPDSPPLNHRFVAPFFDHLTVTGFTSIADICEQDLLEQSQPPKPED